MELDHWSHLRAIEPFGDGAREQLSAVRPAWGGLLGCVLNQWAEPAFAGHKTSTDKAMAALR